MLTKPPCGKDCPKRSVHCHSTCKEFKIYEDTHAKEMSDIRKAKENERIYMDFKFEAVERTKNHLKGSYSRH